MATLPIIPLPSTSVEVGGVEVEIRSLSRAEVAHCASFKDSNDLDGAEIYVIACGTGLSEDVVRAWRESTPTTDVGVLVDAIGELSGFKSKDGKDPEASTSER